jgi:formylmethanofuran dehydrogenase subunit C
MIELRLTAALDAPLDLSGVTPAALTDLKLEQIKRLKVPYGRTAVALGELFALRGTPDTTLSLTDLTAHVHSLGAHMRSGTLRLEGTCGDQVGAEMRGGELQLHGTARDRLGAGMRGGVIRVEGSVGDFVGGSIAGATTGMKGGTILISRHAGSRAGDRMRRGIIAVGGNAGTGCASQMVAGTVVVFGTLGPGYASGMRRGSLLLRESAFAAPETFVKTGQYNLSFIALLGGYLAQLKPSLGARLRTFGAVERWVGDRGCDGLGEILVAKA